MTPIRFSGGTHGLMVGHVSPEAYDGGPIALIHEGDSVSIDVPAQALQVHVSDAELATRRSAWQQPEPRYKHGLLAKFLRQVSSASKGAVTH